MIFFVPVNVVALLQSRLIMAQQLDNYLRSCAAGYWLLQQPYNWIILFGQTKGAKATMTIDDDDEKVRERESVWKPLRSNLSRIASNLAVPRIFPIFFRAKKLLPESALVATTRAMSARPSGVITVALSRHRSLPVSVPLTFFPIFYLFLLSFLLRLFLAPESLGSRRREICLTKTIEE